MANHRPAPQLKSVSGLVLVAPLTVLMAATFVYPIAIVAWTSLGAQNLTFDAYGALLSSKLFWRVLQTTFEISLTAMIVSLIAGYPVALHISRQPPHRRTIYLMLVMLPFWTSILVKSFALTVLFGHRGLFNALVHLTVSEDLNIELVFNRIGVVIGMIQYLLPFMILSILGSVMAQDPTLARAAETMGSGRLRIFWRITFPLSLPGVLAGSIITFTLSIGMYITPALLGGRQDVMMANLVDFYTRQTLDWPAAAATAMILFALSGALVVLLGRTTGGTGMLGGAH